MQILVLGMHRSGTSVLARLLNMLGLYFAPEGVSTGANQENAKGFWERRDVRQANDRLLQAAGADWDRVGNFSIEKIPQEELKCVQQTIRSIVLELDAHRPWFIKEPRLCLLLPVWRPLLEMPICIHIYRHPLEVALSLRERNGFSIPLGLALWEYYTLAAFAATAGVPRVLISHAELLQSPVETLQLVAARLMKLGVRGLREPAEAEINAFIQPSLHHHRAGGSSDAQDYLLKNHRKLAKMIESGAILELGPTKLPKLSPYSLDLLKAHDTSGEKLAELRDRMRESQAKINRLEQTVREKEMGLLRQKIATLETRLGEREGQIQHQLEKAHTLQQAVERRDRQIQDQQEKAVGLREAIESLQETEHRLKKDLVKLGKWSDRIAHDLGRLLKSNRWRIGCWLSLKSAGPRSKEAQRLGQVIASRPRPASGVTEPPRQSAGPPVSAGGPNTAATCSQDADLATHYLKFGHREGRDPGPFFATKWYRKRYPEIGDANPLLDYPREGAKKGHDPGPDFGTSYYLAQNPDVAKAGVNPLMHYIRRGRKEKRRIAPAGEWAALTAAAKPKGRDAALTEAGDEKFVLLAKPGSDRGGTAIGSLRSSLRNAQRPYIEKNFEALARGIAEYKNKRRSQAIEQGNVAVFTAITGDFEDQKIHAHLNANIDYYLFTDTPIEDCGLYNIIPANYFNVDPRRSARFFKTHAHWLFGREYEIAVWIDSNIIMLGDALDLMIAGFRTSKMPIGAISHPFRSSVYEEAAECVHRKMDSEEIISKQVHRYKQEGFDCDNLIETNLMMFNLKQPNVDKFLDIWWAEIERGSRRDQLSVNYSLAKAGLDYFQLTKKPNSIRNHPHFAVLTHDPLSGNTSEIVAALSVKAINPFDGPSFASVREERIRPYRQMRIDIVICIHNALDDVRLCLASIARHASNHHVILVDDGSDQETRDYLMAYADRNTHVALHRNEKAVGYTCAANIGLRLSTAEFVILLNSDTIVTDVWAEKMADALFSTPGAGIVGPMSNAASHQSLPDHQSGKQQTAINELPPALTPERLNRLCEEQSTAHIMPRVPLVHGFCFGIARRVIDAIGVFDEANFPTGYGEESDYCFRAADNGFGLVTATHTYVYHAKSKSFVGPERTKLMEAGGRALRALHGDARVDRAVRSMQENPAFKRMRDAARVLYEEVGASTKACQSKAGSKTPAPKKSSPDWLRETIRWQYLMDYASISSDQLEQNKRLVSQRTKLHQPPKVVSWFIPPVEHALKGGVRTIFLTARNFSEHWNTRNLFFVLSKGQIAPDLSNLSESLRASFPGLQFSVRSLSSPEEMNALPESDIGICSLWTTAYALAKYNRTKRKFYFMQDYEPNFYPASAISGAIEATYRFGFSCIANTKGVADCYKNYSDDVMFFSPGVDRSIYYPDPGKVRPKRPAQIVFYGRPGNPRNGFALGLNSLRMIKDSLGDSVRIVSVGAEWDEAEFGVKGVVENLGLLPTLEDVARLYRESDVGLVFMFTAHPSYQPIEFMATGCVAVTNHNSANSWLLDHKKNGLMVEPIPELVSEGIIGLLSNPRLWLSLRQGGLATAQGLCWTRAFDSIRHFVMS